MISRKYLRNNTIGWSVTCWGIGLKWMWKWEGRRPHLKAIAWHGIWHIAGFNKIGESAFDNRPEGWEFGIVKRYR